MSYDFFQTLYIITYLIQKLYEVSVVMLIFQKLKLRLGGLSYLCKVSSETRICTKFEQSSCH